MKDIKVLGSGCANCRNTIALIEQVARDKGVPVTIEKVQDMQAIIGYGVMATPGWCWTARWCMPAACPAVTRSRPG